MSYIVTSNQETSCAMLQMMAGIFTELTCYVFYTGGKMCLFVSVFVAVVCVL